MNKQKWLGEKTLKKKSNKHELSPIMKKTWDSGTTHEQGQTNGAQYTEQSQTPMVVVVINRWIGHTLCLQIAKNLFGTFI